MPLTPGPAGAPHPSPLPTWGRGSASGYPFAQIRSSEAPTHPTPRLPSPPWGGDGGGGLLRAQKGSRTWDA